MKIIESDFDRPRDRGLIGLLHLRLQAEAKIKVHPRFWYVAFFLRACFGEALAHLIVCTDHFVRLIQVLGWVSPLFLLGRLLTFDWKNLHLCFLLGASLCVLDLKRVSSQLTGLIRLLFLHRVHRGRLWITLDFLPHLGQFYRNIG